MAPSRKRGGKASALAARHEWIVGDLVLAKVKGFPAWPAQISNPEDWGRANDPRKIFVFFFGTKQIGYCNSTEITPFTCEIKSRLLAKSQLKNATADFCQAVTEICSADEKGSTNFEVDGEDSLQFVNEDNEREHYSPTALEDKAQDSKRENSKKKMEVGTPLVFDRNKRNLDFRQSHRVVREGWHDGIGVAAANSAEIKEQVIFEDEEADFEKLMGNLDGLVEPEQNPKQRYIRGENKDVGEKDMLAMSPRSIPSFRRTSSRNARSSIHSSEQKEATFISHGGTLGVKQEVKKRRGDLRRISRNFGLTFGEGDTETQMGSHDLVSPGTVQPDQANQPSSEGSQSKRKARRLVKDHRGLTVRGSPKAELEMQRESSLVDSLNGELQVNAGFCLNRQVSELSDDSENRLTFEKDSVKFALHGEHGRAAFLLEFDNDGSRQVGGDAISHAPLPKKKRRAIRKPDREFNRPTCEAIDTTLWDNKQKKIQAIGASTATIEIERGHSSAGSQTWHTLQVTKRHEHDTVATERKGDKTVSPKLESHYDNLDATENWQSYASKCRKTTDTQQLKVLVESSGGKHLAEKCFGGGIRQKKSLAVTGKELLHNVNSLTLDINATNDMRPTIPADEHLPSVKRVRSHMENELQRQLCTVSNDADTGEGEQADGVAERQRIEALPEGENVVGDFSGSAQVPGPRMMEDSVLGLHSLIDVMGGSVGSAQAPRSGTIVEREENLPLKTDKYRIRSSLADDEAALPPSKRRHRAFEAMSACAAEADVGTFDFADVQEDASSSELRLPDAAHVACETGYINEFQLGIGVLVAPVSEDPSSWGGQCKNDATQHSVAVTSGNIVSNQLVLKIGVENDIDLSANGRPERRLGDDIGTHKQKFNEEISGCRSSAKLSDSHFTAVKKLDSAKLPMNHSSSRSLVSPVKSNGNVDIAKGQLDKSDTKPKVKIKNHNLAPSKELSSGHGHLPKQGANDGFSHADKSSHEFRPKLSEHITKNQLSQSEIVVKVAEEVPSEKGKTPVKVIRTKVNGANMLTLVDTVSVKGPFELNANRVRDAVEAAKEVKQKILLKDGEVPTPSMSMKYLIAAAQAKRQSRSTTVATIFSKSESEKLPTTFISSPSPGCDSLVSSPAQVLHTCLSQNLPRVASADLKTLDALFNATQESDEEKLGSVLRTETEDGILSGDTETAIARDTFEGMLETLSRTRESIARATRHALDCIKYGLAEQVVEIIVEKLENEPSFHRRIDLFFLVDSITQCSHQVKGIPAATYPPAVQAALPRLLNAAAPPGSVARENRRQCLKVFKLWLERDIMPESILKGFMNELESYNEDKTSVVILRRPSRSERACDDPIREMEGMHVDEYGSNASFSLSGFIIPRMYEDGDEACDDTKEFENDMPNPTEEMQEISIASSKVVEKHRHILEDVDGELEMEDVSPVSEHGIDLAREQFGGAPLGLDCAMPTDGAGYLQGEILLPPLPLDPPPPPECPPPSPPPLPASPPPPPPPSSPPPLPPLPSSPSVLPISHSLPHVYSYTSSSSLMDLQLTQLSPVMLQSVKEVGYLMPAEELPVRPTMATPQVSPLSCNEKRFEHYQQTQLPVLGVIQSPSQNSAQTVGLEQNFTPPSGYMISQTPPQPLAIVPTSSHISHIQPSHIGNSFSQVQYQHLPPPAPPPNAYSYGSSEIVHQCSSSPSFEREQHSPHFQGALGDQRHAPQNDPGRRLYEEIHHNRIERQVGDRGTGYIQFKGHIIGETGENAYCTLYPPDVLPRLGGGTIGPVPFTCSLPGVQMQGMPQATAGGPHTPVSNADIFKPLYMGRTGMIPGSLVLGVAANQTQLRMLSSMPGGSTPNPWRPS